MRSERRSADTVRVLGLPVTPIPFEEAAQQCLRMGDGEGRPGFVVTVGALLAVQANRSLEIVRMAEQAALVVPDGAGLVWAAKRRGHPAAERVPGIELAERLLLDGGRRKWKVFLVGSRADTVAGAAAWVEHRVPGIRIVGYHDGFFTAGSERERDLISAVRAARPNLLLVGLGQPRQEFWLRDHLAETEARLAIGVGGSFDVWAGAVARAPGWMGRAGLEWAWRLLRQPWRAWRMRHLPVFVWQARRAESMERRKNSGA